MTCIFIGRIACCIYLAGIRKFIVFIISLQILLPSRRWHFTLLNQLYRHWCCLWWLLSYHSIRSRFLYSWFTWFIKTYEAMRGMNLPRQISVNTNGTRCIVIRSITTCIIHKEQATMVCILQFGTGWWGHLERKLIQENNNESKVVYSSQFIVFSIA